MEYRLHVENFLLSITPKAFEEDAFLPSNTIMEVAIQSNGFSARTTMDIDVKELAKFALDCTHVYESLLGEARIEEPYGMHMFLSFIGDGRGHILIQGHLNQGNHLGNKQTLTFENEIDQTCLKSFSYGLLNDYKKYLQ